MRTGYSGIYAFAFRIYGDADLGDVNVGSADERFRVSQPVPLRHGMSTLSPDFPPDRWPLFRWSPWAGRSQRILPPKTEAPYPSYGSAVYDGFRVDYWGKGSDVRANEFVTDFLAWVRLSSGQDWIGRYEPHTDVSRQYSFGIDDVGRTVDRPYGHGKTYTGHPWTRGVTKEVWWQAAELALAQGPPPEYWIVFQDGGLAFVIGDSRAAVMNLSLALEVARDVLLVKFSAPASHPLLGTVLGEPFRGTDLLKHLTTNLESVHPNGANAEKDLPSYWPAIRRLYIARHHVAHGKPAIAPGSGTVRALTSGEIFEIMIATRETLRWLEQL